MVDRTKLLNRPGVVALFGGLEKQLGGCEIYRVAMPLYALGKTNRWDTGWTWLGELLLKPQKLALILSATDVVVFPRLYMPEASEAMIDDFFGLLEESGVRTVYEVDDDFTNEYRHVIDGDAMVIARRCDAITVTTPLLAERMTKLTGRKSHVLPNSIDPNVWMAGEVKRKVADGDVIIALTGSATHAQDWSILEGVLPSLLDKYPFLHVILGGYTPDYIGTHPRLERIPPLDYARYANMLRQCDIVLAPVDPTDKFNLFKSPIKAVEGMSAQRMVGHYWGGSAVIATRNPVYELAIDNGKDGLLLPHERNEWIAALERVIEDKDYRQRLQWNAWKRAQKDFLITRNVRLWEKAYRDVLS